MNGQPGAICRHRDNKVLFTLTLDVLDGQIQAIRSVSNPDKLGHVGPVADAWAIARDFNQPAAAGGIQVAGWAAPGYTMAAPGAVG